MTTMAVIGAGFVGHALAVGGARRGWQVEAIGRSDPFGLADTDPGPGRLSFLPGDGVQRLPEVLEHQVDHLVIAAGGYFPVSSVSAPAADAIGTLSLVIGLCESVRSLSPQTRVVWLSSAGAVYSPGEGLKSEAGLVEPISPYGMSRRMGEEYMDYYRRVHGLSTHSLRCVNIYGRLLPRSRGQGVISAAFWSALTKTPFTLYGDGRQARDFLHVDDFTRATLDLIGLGRDFPATLNLGTGAASSLVELLDAVRAATRAEISTTVGPSGATHTGTLAVDTTLLRALVDFSPLELRDGIARMAREIATEHEFGADVPDAHALPSGAPR